MVKLSLSPRLFINLVINLHKKSLNWKPRIVECCLIFQPKLLQYQILEYTLTLLRMEGGTAKELNFMNWMNCIKYCLLLILMVISRLQ